MARLFAPCLRIEGKPLILSHAIEIDEASGFLREWRARHCITGCEVCFLSIHLTQEKIMATKQQKQPVVRKPTKKIADSRRVRYGVGCAPAKIVRSADAATSNSGAIRFGVGCAPASLRK
jgi:hypothetical protein